jgi:DNA processing protein
MSARRLSPEERLDWLRLCRTDRVGPVNFYQLLARFGSAGAALEALPRLALRGGARHPAEIAPRAAAQREMETLDRLGARLVCWGEPDYPPLLAEVPDAPPVLAVKGRLPLLQERAVAIVGARNASALGRRFAEDLARELGRAGLAVVSGLARGIDAAAHHGAIETGTIAVVAGGVNVVYPEENRRLHQAIGEHGAILAELPPGTEPQARHFPRRNRIVSGISLGVVVVEAALRSGSLITARLAGEQGRLVFAVPGSPLDPRSQGANDLIRTKDATLVQGAADVLEDLAGMAGTAAPRRPRFTAPARSVPEESEVDGAHRTVLELLSPTPVAVDELVRRCHLSAAVVASVLLELELAGRISRHPGNRVALA